MDSEAKKIPDMSQVEFEDRLRILLGVPPEGVEITIMANKEGEQKNRTFKSDAQSNSHHGLAPLEGNKEASKSGT